MDAVGIQLMVFCRFPHKPGCNRIIYRGRFAGLGRFSRVYPKGTPAWGWIFIKMGFWKWNEPHEYNTVYFLRGTMERDGNKTLLFKSGYTTAISTKAK